MRRLLPLVALALAGCASQPENIQTQYVSDVQYQTYDCGQLGLEESRISRRVGQLHGSLQQKATADGVQMGIGLLVFWPALFLLEGGDGPEAQEYARLKGEHQAIQRISVQKKCALNITPLDDQIKDLDGVKKAEVRG